MNKQPNSLHCFVCGVENDAGLHMRFFETETDPVEVKAEYTIPEHFQGYPGIAHGGVLAAMLDEVTSRTVFRGDPPRLVVTGQLSIRYHKPVPVEMPLHLTGRVIQDRGRIIKVAGEIQDLDGMLLASAEAVLIEVKAEFFGNVDIGAQNWKVIPEEPAEVDDDR